jgi:foldase protein PrsA
LDSGEAFYTVAKNYGGEEESETELKRGQLDTAFENAAFDLKTGETSDIVEAQGKYYIIKCTSDNEKYKTEANKLELIEQKKLEYFNSVFEEYEASKYVEFNKNKWNATKAGEAMQLSVSFEDILNEYVK